MSKSVSASLLVLALSAAAGCSPPAAEAPAAPAGETPVAAASGDALQPCAAMGRIDPVPGPSVTTTCAIALEGAAAGSSLKVELVSGPVGEELILNDEAKVRVTRMTGAQAGQVMEETLVTLLVAPDYRDVNGDGQKDLLIVRDQGNVNSVYGVWFADPEGGPFVRVGEVGGEFGPVTADGYMTVSSRGSAATQCVGFYRMADQQLSLAASACITAENEAATQTSCVLEEVDAPDPIEMTEENRAKFCAEPVVANAFR